MANGSKPPGWKEGYPDPKHDEPGEKPEQKPETPEKDAA